MNTKRTHVVLAEALVEDIDRLVGARQRSAFLAEGNTKDFPLPALSFHTLPEY